MLLRDLPFNSRARQCFMDLQIDTVEELMQIPEDELKAAYNVGNLTVLHIQEVLDVATKATPAKAMRQGVLKENRKLKNQCEQLYGTLISLGNVIDAQIEELERFRTIIHRHKERANQL